MYTAKLNLNGTEYIGKLTFSTLINIQKILKKDFKKNISIHEIFILLSQKDMEVLSVFLLETFKTVDANISEKNVVNNFIQDINSNIELSIQKYIDIFTYINELMEECMPKAEQKEDSEFEDIPEIGEVKDWELDHMEYLWESILKRNNFYNITPKQFFLQMSVYRKVNNIEEEKVEEI